MTIIVEVPEQTAVWLAAEGEKEFRTPEEQASIIIRKAQRKAEDEMQKEFLNAIGSIN